MSRQIVRKWLFVGPNQLQRMFVNFAPQNHLPLKTQLSGKSLKFHADCYKCYCTIKSFTLHMRSHCCSFDAVYLFITTFFMDTLWPYLRRHAAGMTTALSGSLIGLDLTPSTTNTALLGPLMGKNNSIVTMPLSLKIGRPPSIDSVLVTTSPVVGSYAHADDEAPASRPSPTYQPHP